MPERVGRKPGARQFAFSGRVAVDSRERVQVHAWRHSPGRRGDRRRVDAPGHQHGSARGRALGHRLLQDRAVAFDYRSGVADAVSVCCRK